MAIETDRDTEKTGPVIVMPLWMFRTVVGIFVAFYLSSLGLTILIMM